MTQEARHIVDSGDLDLYALGVLDEKRCAEIELVLQRDAELQRELKVLQQALENVARSKSRAPRPELRRQILDAAFKHEQEAKIISTPKPAARETTAPLTTPNAQSPKQAQRIELSDNFRDRYLQVRRYAIAASIALMLTSSSAVYLWMRNNGMSEQLSQTQTELALMRTQQGVVAARLEMHDKHFAMLHDDRVKMIRLDAQGPAPHGSSSMVMWNRETHEVYLDAAMMPANKAQTDYQLWALVDGKPVDLGVYNTATNMPMAQMKSIDSADAFAITLEPKGGSKTPTLSQLMVMGKIAS